MSLALPCRIPFAPAVLLAMAIAGALPRPALARECDVRAFGAAGKKEQDASKAIQRAIDACARAGGGRVHFPSGAYTSGPLILRSHIRLHLEAGATLFATTDNTAYRPKAPAGKEDAASVGYEKVALLYGENVEDVSIEGHGIIDGQARYEWAPARKEDGFIASEIASARAFGVDLRRAYAIEPLVATLVLAKARDVSISDVSFKNSRSWTLHLWDCDRVRIRGIQIDNSRTEGVNADGIDIDGSRDVHVSDSTISAGDDAICLKSSALYGPPRPVENVTVTNCVLSSTSSAFKLGTETHADMRNIVLSNSVIRDSNRGLGIIVRDGARVSDVLFSNLTIETTRHDWFWWGNGDPFWFVVLKRTPESRVGSIENVTVSNVIARSRGTGRIAGFAGAPLRGITLDRVKLLVSHDDKRDPRTTHAIAASDVAGLAVRDVEVAWQGPPSPRWQSAFYGERVSDLVLDGFGGRQAPGSQAAAVTLVDVDGAWLAGNRAAAGTSTFFAISGARTRRIRIGDNMLTEARAAIARAPGVAPGAVVFKEAAPGSGPSASSAPTSPPAAPAR